MKTIVIHTIGHTEEVGSRPERHLPVNK